MTERNFFWVWIWVMSLLYVPAAFATDFEDSAETRADPSLDLLDYYVWASAPDRVSAVLTVHPAVEETSGFDPAVAYVMQFDTRADQSRDALVAVRIGQNAVGEWGYYVVANLIEAQAPLGEEVTLVDAQGEFIARVWVGIADNPAFVDTLGMQTSVDSGVWSFDGNRDGFAGSNVIAIVVELDRNLVLRGATEFDTWAVTTRYTP